MRDWWSHAVKKSGTEKGPTAWRHRLFDYYILHKVEATTGDDRIVWKLAKLTAVEKRNKWISRRLRLPNEQQIGVVHANGKIQLATRPSALNDGWQRLCFAGQDDELFVLAESHDHNLSIWSLPESQGREQVLDHPLVVLKGHKD